MALLRKRIARRSILQQAPLAIAFGATSAWAENSGTWPDRSVRLIVPYPAGGSTDILFRMLADKLKEKLGQSFVVENRPGASGNVGIDVIAKSAPDGYAIGAATIGHFSINQFLFANMPYNAERELVAPSLTYEMPNVAVVVPKHVTTKTLGEFIAWAKARSNGITIGSRDRARRHISQVSCSGTNGRQAVHVPFRGAAQRFRRCSRAMSILR